MPVKLLAIIGIWGLFLTTAPTALSFQGNLSLTMESIFASDDFKNKSFDNLQWAADGASFTYTRRNVDTTFLDIYAYHIPTNTTSLILAGHSLIHKGTPLNFSHYQWTKGHRFLLLTGPKHLTWDNVVEAPYYIYDTTRNKIWPLADNNAALRNVKLSPDGEKVGYVLNNNLYTTTIHKQVTQAVTLDGSTNVFNGIFDYGSTEFSSLEAWHWSPDSQKIAFWRLDASDVRTYYMLDELGKYNSLRKLKYPNTGERHAVIKIGVFTLKNSQTVWMDIGRNPDDYIPLIHWGRSSQKLLLQRLARDHKTLDLLLADTGSGKSRIIHSETDPAWIDITNDLRMLAGQDRFVWTSEKSGYRHAYIYDYDGHETQLTSGDWEISSLTDLDEKSGWLYFTSKKKSFIEQHVYRVNLAGTDLQSLTGKPGWYDWQMSPNGRYAIEQFSDAQTPPRLTLKQANGKTLGILEENKIAGVDKYRMPHPEFVKVTTTDGIVLNASMVKPTNFDPGKKYPVIAYGYGNAGSQVVRNRWGGHRATTRDLWHRYMAEQGFIIFSIDNRTTAGRGKKAKNLTYKHYAKYAVLDQLEGVKYLKTLPYIDETRIGFWGWSGGGYLAAALMTKGAPHYKVGVSVAPVIDLTRYQSVGVERWMSFIEDNQAGYDAVNLINFADKLEGKLLLIHGSGDENVKYAFTLQFADALIKHNKQFDMMIYPNEHHGISGAQMHVFTKIRNYFLDNL
ncbi:MAG: hypothetical protein COB54_07220 [Alphaproteobacteria bacterium]|nr:MAG: hypothetical protein COB54_07220 [Alphaproteobacteria bacterium]